MFKKGIAVCYGLAVCDVLIPGVPRDAFTSETTRIPRFAYSTGGDAINQAVALVKLGHEARLMSVVGADLFGDFIIQEGSKAGVDMDGVRRDPLLPTTVSLVFVHPDGERSFILNHGADNGISEACIDWEALKDAAVVSVGSAFASPGLTRALPKLLGTAKENGSVTCVDVIRGPGEASVAEMKAFLPFTDYIFPNYDEACWLTGETELPRIARRLAEWGAKNIVVKLGKEGCHLFDPRGRHTHVPGFSIDDLKDSTGAGDHFAAGFIAALMEGKTGEDCARFANAVAACSVRYLGACGLRGREEVRALIDQQGEG